MQKCCENREKKLNQNKRPRGFVALMLQALVRQVEVNEMRNL